MTEAVWWGILLGATVLGVFAVAAAVRRGAVGKAKARIDGLEGELRKAQGRVSELESLLEGHLELGDERDKSHSELAEQVREAVAEAKAQEGRALRYFDCIERIEKQRDYWNERYHEQARSHSVAQAMMLREIHRLAVRLNAHEEREKRQSRSVVAPELKEIYDDFVERHVDPGTAHQNPPPGPREDAKSVG